MLLKLYIIRTYDQLDTWSRGTKQSQTKPIFRDLPLPAKRKTSLTFFVTKPYATTPQTQKRTQTNPISPLQPPDRRTGLSNLAFAAAFWYCCCAGLEQTSNPAGPGKPKRRRNQSSLIHREDPTMQKHKRISSLLVATVLFAAPASQILADMFDPACESLQKYKCPPLVS